MLVVDHFVLRASFAGRLSYAALLMENDGGMTSCSARDDVCVRTN